MCNLEMTLEAIEYAVEVEERSNRFGGKSPGQSSLHKGQILIGSRSRSSTVHSNQVMPFPSASPRNSRNNNNATPYIAEFTQSIDSHNSPNFHNYRVAVLGSRVRMNTLRESVGSYGEMNPAHHQPHQQQDTSSSLVPPAPPREPREQ